MQAVNGPNQNDDWALDAIRKDRQTQIMKGLAALGGSLAAIAFMLWAFTQLTAV
jgi:hypothetical protein